MTCDGGDILEGTAPASVALTVSGTPAGTAVLTDAALTVGTQDYHWTFTPSDTANYNTKTGIISLTVRELPPAVLTGISAVTTRTVYTHGDALDKSTVTVTAAYDDSSSRTVTDYQVSCANGSALAAGDTSVTLSCTGAASPGPAPWTASP